MKTIDNDQIERLLEDISSIKATINRNRPVLQQVLNPARFRWFMFLVAFSIIGFSMFIYFLMQHYGSFNAVPGTLRTVIYIAIAADVVFLQIWKLKSFSISVRKVDQRFTLGWFFKEFYSPRIVHLWVPLIVLVVFLSIFFLVNDIPYFIVPTISIGYGLLCNFVGTLLEIRYSLVIGYWLLITGVCTIIFSCIPGPIALSITLGCGMLIYAISGFLSPEPKEAD